MESVTESGSFSLFGGESLDRFQVEVEIQMKIVQIFTVDKEHEHVEALSTKVKTHLDPVHFSVLEKLCASKGSHQTSFFVRSWFFLVQFILDPLF